MKKSHLIVVASFILMFLKTTLWLIEGNAVFWYTNIAGVLLLIAFSFTKNSRLTNKFRVGTLAYLLLNIGMVLMNVYEINFAPMLNTTYLLLSTAIFAYPIIAFLVFIRHYPEWSSKLVLLMLRVSLVLTVIVATIFISGLTLLTGITFHFVLVAVVIACNYLAVLGTLINLFRTQWKKTLEI